MSRRAARASVANLVADYFAHAVCDRGEAYYEAGVVQVENGDAWCLEATVTGNDPYDVSAHFDPSSGLLDVWCTCPFWEDRLEPCKHLWAAFRQADDDGLLRSALGAGFRGLAVDLDIANEPSPERRSLPRARGIRAPRVQKTWKDELAAISHAVRPEHASGSSSGVTYAIDVGETLARGHLATSVEGAQSPSGLDADIFGILEGVCDPRPPWERASYGYRPARSARFEIPPAMQPTLVRMMCETGRAVLKTTTGDRRPITWDDGDPWLLAVEVRQPDPASFQVAASIRRGDRCLPLAEPDLLTAGGLVFSGDRVGTLEPGTPFPWISVLRKRGPLAIPAGESDELLARLLEMPAPPRLELPETLRYERVETPPTPRLAIAATGGRRLNADRLSGKLSFDYAGTVLSPADPRAGIFDPSTRRFVPRQLQTERDATKALYDVGFRSAPAFQDAPEPVVSLARRHLSKVVRDLAARGWWIEAEGRVVRSASNLKIEVRSGVDWFDLHGAAHFNGQTATLPELLQALREGSDRVRLDDGTDGLLPETWLKRLAPVTQLGETTGDRVRFSASQVGLLDALLAAQPESSCDEAFAKARSRLAGFDGVRPRNPTAGFDGDLREYQREGLGWLHFLRDFGFGGCLADDMGLGKTVQVLALLESRRQQRRRRTVRPSLVVVPRSLVQHWIREAGRFSPKLSVLDHTGPQRLHRPDGRPRKTLSHFDRHDLIVTTYGTLRRDAEHLSTARFDYAILDEAQAIKNADTASAKAARLLRADHRLALSGTPIENHVGELFSLFAFLQPGLLGRMAPQSKMLARPDEDTQRLLAGAVRPFILRRTKTQVAKDLPEKLEQDLVCDLAPKQRRLYEELRDHYRASLLSRAERQGLNRSKMHVLEALLRLRQTACHPGLVDRKHAGGPAAKLETLLAHVEVALEEGHKTLVFSQFTKLLAFVRRELDARKISYEYLDGRTRKRAEKVDRFQTDPSCRVFLISLKAGGTGLNLTAADYVFLLDPWWNPAVETQAIDRTHRIGQTRRVFAYRLIARDTIEERIRELQESKRQLADAIIGENGSVLRDLTLEDLRLLLS